MKLRTVIFAAILAVQLPIPNCASAQIGADIDDRTPGQPDAERDDKSDVNAIGTRKIGARGLGNWYSLEYESKLGQQWAKMTESRLRISEDPLITAYVDRIGQLLVRNSDAQVPFIIKVIDDPGGINTFAFPGGFLYVSSGLLLAADNEAEMAGVMAHEIAHVTAHHAARQITRENMSEIATMPLALVAGPFGQALRGGAGLVLPLSMSKFSRGFETEADYLGLQYMYKAGYDPHAFISFLERTARLVGKRSTMKRAFSMYPKDADRIKKDQEEIQRVLPPTSEYIVSTSDFDDVKARLAAGRDRPKLNDRTHAGPVLRRLDRWAH